MAKREECHFDTDGFIEGFRTDAVPGYHTASAHESGGGAEKKKSDVSHKTPASTNLGNGWIDPEEEDSTLKYMSLNMTDSEIEYIKDFIVKNNFRQVTQKGRQVMIRERHRKMIKTIMELLGENANMATYIDNVLTQHFRYYYPTIMGIAKKCPPKF